ncbi:hypothetical protein PCASD_14143 [Puccinia coronata f. sp. avenae]|uniref:Uncharacterized protein n=1 Tax=Puccinia coronata f. sp. avenae TaxID=200324 RepID=A0A2N5UFZ5_9BASI|nr:hypothetical protein PCASD_14143 [Puccinia coronata f. sp. avenae]
MNILPACREVLGSRCYLLAERSRAAGATCLPRGLGQQVLPACQEVSGSRCYLLAERSRAASRYLLAERSRAAGSLFAMAAPKALDPPNDCDYAQHQPRVVLGALVATLNISHVPVRKERPTVTTCYACTPTA